MTDKRYRHPVAELDPDKLGMLLRKSIGEVQANFPPKTGVCVFVFDFSGPGSGQGMGYISNAQRDDMVKALQEWIDRESKRA